MEDKEYWEQISTLTDKLNLKEKEIFDIVLGIDDEFSHEEARKKSTLIFYLWEAVVHYKATLTKLEKVEEVRFKEKFGHPYEDVKCPEK